MQILFHKKTNQFHLTNNEMSYIVKVLENGDVINLYCGAKVHDKEDFSYAIFNNDRPMAVYNKSVNGRYNLTTLKREYPNYGTGDYRYSAFEIMQENGSHITAFKFKSYEIFDGKKELKGLPATYVEENCEAKTLEITLEDKLLDLEIVLSYTIFDKFNVIARNAKFVNNSNKTVSLTKALSLSLDLQDNDFEMISLEGAWSREREIVKSKIRQGYQGIYSNQGASSSEHNPFIALKKTDCTENMGEAYGFALVYSGNHVEQVEVSTQGYTRVSVGINPQNFTWQLNANEEFQTPEAVMVYSDKGLNYMSQTFHEIFRTRLARGHWRDKVRPILLNNWESTGMNFTENQIVEMAKIGKDLGIELFVLDDGWFGGRDNDKRGLGDWFVTDFYKLPNGIEGLCKKINDIGLDFGLWFEPEMANEDSELYRNHPEYVLQTPERDMSVGRNQYVLDFSNPEVVKFIFDMMYKVVKNSNISYIKWDMNRYISECYSLNLPNSRQGEVYHRYILGVYSLYQMLIDEFPEILFESCASGGSRFDAGLLYYAPQAWTSDDTDAMERIKIQYGTSMLYPVTSMGAHVSVSPNHQTGRTSPFETRGNVAMFGAFGYELDVTKLTDGDKALVREQVEFFKKHRSVIQQGTFYRIESPFENKYYSAWQSVSKDKTEAVVGFYRNLVKVNSRIEFVKVQGLKENSLYKINDSEEIYSGTELAKIGIAIIEGKGCSSDKDFTSKLYYVKEIKA